MPYSKAVNIKKPHIKTDYKTAYTIQTGNGKHSIKDVCPFFLLPK